MPVEVEEDGASVAENSMGISLFPNPTTGYLEIQLNDLAAAKISVKDCRGRLLLDRDIEGSASLDLLNFPDGVYLLTIKTNLGLWTQKVVKLAK